MRASVSRSHVLRVDVENVSYADLRRRAARPVRPVLAGDVVGEDSLSLDKLRLSASRADLLCAVSDDERGPLVASGGAKPKSDSFGVLGHRPNIRLTSAMEVQSFPATREITSRPRLASVRNAADVSPNCAATTPRRCGVLVSTEIRGGSALMALPNNHTSGLKHNNLFLADRRSAGCKSPEEPAE
jgi:hypothetical protein